MEQTYLKNTPIQEALAAYLAAFSRLPAKRSELVPTIRAAGRITAEALYARQNVPHYLACAMDGIAVRAADTFGASDLEPVALNPGQFVVVDTGDPLPDGCDAVIMIEEVIRLDDHLLVATPATPQARLPGRQAPLASENDAAEQGQIPPDHDWMESWKLYRPEF